MLYSIDDLFIRADVFPVSSVAFVIVLSVRLEGGLGGLVQKRLNRDAATVPADAVSFRTLATVLSMPSLACWSLPTGLSVDFCLSTWIETTEELRTSVKMELSGCPMASSACDRGLALKSHDDTPTDHIL
jgi:hypothetical protein